MHRRTTGIGRTALQIVVIAVLGATIGYFGLSGRSHPFVPSSEPAIVAGDAAPALPSRVAGQPEGDPPNAGQSQPSRDGAADGVDPTQATQPDKDRLSLAAELSERKDVSEAPANRAVSGESAIAVLSAAERLNREAVARAEEGDMIAAAALLRDAHRLEPSNEQYASNLQAALVNAGFSEITSEHFDRAVAHFVEALKLGDRAEVRRGLGYAYYRLGNIDLARTSLERVLEQGAGDIETWVTLGRIYLERQDQRRALLVFEQALEAGAKQPGLTETVAKLRRDAEAEEGFHALASSHFVLKFEGRENTEAGRLVLNALEDAYRRVGARFAYYPLERQEVVLYSDQAFRTVTNSPHWSGAVYDGRIKLPIGGLQRGSDRLNRTLRHEYAHAAIVALSRSKAPVWMNEGLAQIAEEAGDQGRGARLQRAVAEQALFPLSQLEAGFNHLDREQASLAYAEAYYAADYLLKQKGPYNVRRLLEAMASAESTDAAFRQTLSLSYAEFEQRFMADVVRRAR